MDPEKSFGRFLKNERELRGITLGEISAATKIHIKYLQALEDERYSDLPGEVFVKGFVRSFAKAIGADGDDIISAYDQLADKKEPSESPVPSPVSDNGGSGSILSRIILSGLLLALAAAGYFYWNQPVPETPPLEIRETPPARPEKPKFIPRPPHSPTTDFSPAMISPPQSRPDEGGENQALDGIEKIAPKNEKHGIIQPPMPVKPGENVGEGGRVSDAQTSTLKDPNNDEALPVKLALGISVRSSSWFQLRVDGLAEYDFILPAGAEKTFRGRNELLLTIGNREGTRLTLNGKPLIPPPGRDNVVRNFIITHKLIE